MIIIIIVIIIKFFFASAGQDEFPDEQVQLEDIDPRSDTLRLQALFAEP